MIPPKRQSVFTDDKIDQFKNSARKYDDKIDLYKNSARKYNTNEKTKLQKHSIYSDEKIDS